jgi:hypothetical protein
MKLQKSIPQNWDIYCGGNYVRTVYNTDIATLRQQIITEQLKQKAARVAKSTKHLGK